jgi:hypothetical protein
MIPGSEKEVLSVSQHEILMKNTEVFSKNPHLRLINILDKLKNSNLILGSQLTSTQRLL